MPDGEQYAISLDNYDALAKAYKPLLYKTALSIHKSYADEIEVDDLLQEGLIALWNAIQNFDPTKGVFFGHYLKVAIRNTMLAYCRNVRPHIYKKRKDGTDYDRIAITVLPTDFSTYNPNRPNEDS